MTKISWKAGNMIYPLPAVMVSCGNCKDNYNIITIAWTGTICTNPPMTYISVKPSRHSYDIIKETGEFVINLTCESLVKATDYCGVKSGRDFDKFKEMNLTIEKATKVDAPMIKESPVNIECKVKDIIPLGSHDMFTAEVVAVNIDDEYLDENNSFHLNKAKPICYSHGGYFGLGKKLGHFGFSVAKKKKSKRKRK
ncbi:flavin reductase family protein [Abyssisolibacter fermentans]|uniref:flavin reductase family protein n=1 Tax=Abyssisolibacter fermentans TaxID=1766203 RepID=UPI000832444C|nr:flavin reductase family protein [Abyssisolibacter fermentans]